jgi:hypothetical protein
MKSRVDKPTLPVPHHMADTNDTLHHSMVRPNGEAKLADKVEQQPTKTSLSRPSSKPIPPAYQPAIKNLSETNVSGIIATKKDVYKNSQPENHTGLVFGFDLQRNQPFVEINFNNSMVGDISWVDGCAEPVITLEPSAEDELRRLPVRQFIQSLTDALGRLGPRDG